MRRPGDAGNVTLGGLRPAPESVLDAAGAPNFGVFAGRVRSSSYEGLSGRWRRSQPARLAAEKKWQYVAAANRNLVVGAAVVQLGYVGSAFVYVFDRLERRLLVDRSFLVPPLFARVSDSPHDAAAELRRVRSRIAIEAGHSSGRFRASLSGGVEIDLALDTPRGPAPLTAVCPVAPSGVNLTQKSTCVPAEGTVRVGPATYRMSDAFAVLDYTHGLLARETRWYWASGCGRLADGRMFGLNLVSGFNDGDELHENGLWLDGRLSRTGRATFEFDESNPRLPWRIRTADGAVDLRFTPEGLRAEDVDMKLVVSRYAQPIGSFSGKVRDPDGRTVQVEAVPGITEHHLARW